MTPNESPYKILPNEKLEEKQVPEATDVITEHPEATPVINETPVESPKVEKTPEATPEKAEKPSDYIEENCVIIGGKKVEIKPTKLKYFRNKAASAYGIIKAVPLHELLTYGKGVIDEKRDADQLLYDFLVSVFDDSEFVKNNYDEIDADVIFKICNIFGRVNHIDEKEEAIRKNKEAQAKR